MTKIIYTFALLFCIANALAQTALVPSGSTWKYLDNGSNQGTAWRTATYNDGSWASGPALLGYGHGDEATVVSYGTQSANKYPTTYFRKTISVANAAIFSNYTLRMRRDDGIVVYINGVEKYRNNMPTGTIAYNTWATTTSSDDGYTWFSTTLATGSLVTGTNVIAVEIHQRKPTSSDISFDLQLTGNGTGGTDVTPPTVSTYSPADNATGISKTVNLVLTFNENIQKGSGNIVIKEGGITIQTIGVTTTDVTVSGNTATLNPADFTNSAAVNIEITAGAFKDLANNNYAGISNATTWNFTIQSGGTSALLTRGPYLQMGNQNAVTLRWRTNIATDSKIEVGTVFGTYALLATNATSTTEHEVRIAGLAADTRYYYRFGSSTQILQSANDNYFTTVPPPTTTRKIRIAAFGDCGKNSLGHQSNTLTAYRNYLTNNSLDAADAWLLLGDNAYETGTDAEFTSNFFNAYASTILKNHKLYPVPGNHDYAGNSSNQSSHNVPYFSIFTLPANAECGGLASGNERYYSYDIGNVHFLALDSYGLENGGTTRMYDTTGAQAAWVKQDLAANTKKWTIAYWHHPPYTMGDHDSDLESELVNIRQKFIRILERLGVDIILCGHSHDYERSYLLNGYYGNESSFSVSTHTKSNSSGKYDGSANSCPYILAAGANHGTVYVVSGSAGASGSSRSGYPHNALPWSINDGGMTYIEVQENRLDLKFIRMDGTIWDKFTLMKEVNKTANLSVAAGTPTTLTASWPSGTYKWSTGATTRSITVSPTSNITYTVSDNTTGACVSDTFNVAVTGGITAREMIDVTEVATY